MPYVMNALPTQITTQVFGKWFTFQPEQVKMIHEVNLAHVMVTKRASDGLIGVPDEVMENKVEYPDKYKSEIEELRRKGVANRVEFLKSIISNLEVSLRRDLEIKNIKADPLSFASSGEVQVYAELSRLETESRNKIETPADRIRKIKEEMNAVNVSNSRTTSPGSPVDAKAAKS